MYFKFCDNNTLHEDLIFTISGEIFECDSFYFFHDKINQKKEKAHIRVKRSLRKLIEQWIELLTVSKQEDVLMLPFGFDDQSTGCLKCSIDCNELSIEIGYSDIESWKLDPSEIKEFAKSSETFSKIRDKNISMDKSKFIENLYKNLNQF